MPQIVLTTLNAKYAHTAFGLRYLMSNLGSLAAQAEIVEFDISQRPVDMLEALLQRSPRIVGLGVYIWNVDHATRLVADLKRVQPDTIVVLGGPEVSYEIGAQDIVRLADYVVAGEGDLAFRELCSELLAGRRPAAKVIQATLPQFVNSVGRNDRSAVVGGSRSSTAATLAEPLRGDVLRLPYDLYSDRDIAERVIYVEASRGCPYECEFCLSSLDIPVRQAPLDAFLEAMQQLLDRGVRQFKFVDRTFNLNLKVSRTILEFFHERYRPGLFLHFEMIPDRLPDSLRDLIQQFPQGALQFEVGVQTFSEKVAQLISRRQDNTLVEHNLRWLRAETGVHVHADLIVGLPGEDLASFAAGFDRLVALKPQEIQVGMLKRLRGTPIVRHDAEWGMVYSPYAPYEILQTKLIDFTTMQQLRRFARYWDLVANSGNFVASTPLIWGDGSPFACFHAFSEWLYHTSGRTNGIALKRLAELLFGYLISERDLDATIAATAVWDDYQRGGRSDMPEFLRPYRASLSPPLTPRAVPGRMARQARHSS